MKRKCLWLVISHVLGMATAMFFYDQPLDIKAAAVDKNTYFGYSLSYRKDLRNLVVGAPNDETGKVFTCSLHLDSTYNEFDKTCARNDKINEYVNELENTTRYDGYKFMLGTSVAALPDSSFVTCAPMWSGQMYAEIKHTFYKRTFNLVDFVWGACFVVKDDEEPKELDENGLYGRTRIRDSLRGNFGMKMLADDDNDLILISKPASPPVKGDIVYIKHTDPLNIKESLIEHLKGFERYKKTIKDTVLANYRNLGKAMATGNFFKRGISEKAIYAIGCTQENADGEVIFIVLMSNGKLKMKLSDKDNALKIEHDTRFSMLGAALCSASLDNNIYIDLIVGAPAQQTKGKMDAECGAIHIYLGSFDANVFVKQKLTIMGNKEGSRFGSTISAYDLDEDGLTEIFISAMYEDDVALYILSGYELKKKLDEHQTRPIISVKDFKTRQEIKKKDDSKLLGFSIIPVPDVDDNGCDELAVGAPGSDRIMILRCIPTIKINVTAELENNEVVRETDNNFAVLVCINLEYQSKMEKIAAKVEMTNTINTIAGGKVTIQDSDKTFMFDDISRKDPKYCRNVSITIDDNRPGYYKFKTQAKLIRKGIDKSAFDRSWVRDSSYSVLSSILPIQRMCRDKECNYNLTMDFKWSGGELNMNDVPAGKYAVGSKNETMTIQISNWGRPAYDACVLIKVEHAPISQLHCTNTKEGYLCELPEGFMPNNKSTIEIELKTSRLTDEYRSFQITADLYNECEKKDLGQSQTITIDYEFNADQLVVTGSPNTRSITEKSMKTNTETIDVIHTYRIENTGSVLWKGVGLNVVVPQEIKDYVKDLKIPPATCPSPENNPVNCSLDLQPFSTTKVVVTVVLRKKEIEKSLMESKLKIITELRLKPKHTTEKNARVEGVLAYEKDSSLGQNKTLIILIAVIVALIIIAVVIFVLYKFGFFKRKQKEELKEEIRRRSVRRSNATSQRQDSLVEIMEEDMDDDAFHCDDPPAIVAGSSTDRHSTRASRRSITKEPIKTEVTAKENEKDE